MTHLPPPDGKQKSEDGRVDPHDRRESIGVGQADKGFREPVRDGGSSISRRRRKDRGNRAVKRELDQNASRRRHGVGHRIEEAAVAASAGEARASGKKIVGVEVRDGEDGALACELLPEPAGAERDKKERDQRAIFQPFAGPLAWRKRGDGSLNIDAKLFRRHRVGFCRGGQPGDRC